MKLCESLSINLKYYRKKYNLSQEKFAEILGTIYLIWIRLKITMSMLKHLLLIGLQKI